MLEIKSPSARFGRWSMLVAGLLIGTFAFTAGVSAQEKKKAPEKAAPAPAANAAADPNQSAWVKLCEKIGGVTKDKDGKEKKEEFNVCLTHHERLDANSGMVIVSAAVRQVQGQDKMAFMVMVPLGMFVQPGMRAAVYTKELWEKLQKNEKIEENQLKPFGLPYSVCHMGGCTAEIELKPELLQELKTGGGLMIIAVDGGSRQPLFFPVPLNGFETTLAGAPVDPEKYTNARRALMEQIAQRQQQYREEMKKQNDELQKMQGPEALKGAKDAAPAAKDAVPAAKDGKK